MRFGIYGANKNAYWISVGNPVRKKPLDDLEVGQIIVGRSDLAQERDEWWALANIAMNAWVPRYPGKFLSR